MCKCWYRLHHHQNRISRTSRSRSRSHARQAGLKNGEREEKIEREERRKKPAPPVGLVKNGEREEQIEREERRKNPAPPVGLEPTTSCYPGKGTTTVLRGSYRWQATEVGSYPVEEYLDS